MRMRVRVHVHVCVRLHVRVTVRVRGIGTHIVSKLHRCSTRVMGMRVRDSRFSVRMPETRIRALCICTFARSS